MNTALESWKIQHTDANGTERTFLIESFYDDYMGAPWDEEDGHGPVSEWTTRDKRAGEWVLCEDRGNKLYRSKRYYNASEAQKIALRDGWSYEGATGTKREIAAYAVKKDFEYLQSWCDNKWCYIFIKVTPLTKSGDELDSLADTLGGIESLSGDYIKQCAHDLAEGISMRMGEVYRMEA